MGGAACDSYFLFILFGGSCVQEGGSVCGTIPTSKLARPAKIAKASSKHDQLGLRWIRKWRKGEVGEVDFISIS